MDLKKVYNNIATSWNNFRNKPLSFVKEYLNKTRGTLLIEGCGSGRHSIIASKNHKVTAIDFSEEMIRIAKSKDSKSNYLISDVRALPFKNKSFDNALSIAVLHHLKPTDLIKALKELKRTVKGSILLSVWKKENKGEQLIKWGEHERYYYIYELNEIKAIIKKEFKKIKQVKDKNNIVLIIN